MTADSFEKKVFGGLVISTIASAFIYYACFNGIIEAEGLKTLLKKEVFDIPSLYGRTSIFIVLYTLFICLSHIICWWAGGKIALIVTGSLWNFEILLYNIYSGRYEYALEHINILILLILLRIQSPADKMREQKAKNEAALVEKLKYELTLNRLIGEMDGSLASVKNHLQEIQFTWRDVLHELRNKLTLDTYNNVEKEVKNQVVDPIIERVLDYLKKLGESYNFEIKKETVSTVIQSLSEHLNKDFSRRHFFNISTPEKVSKKLELNCNVHALQRVLVNIVQNSFKAISRARDRAREEDVNFKPIIKVAFCIKEQSNQQYLEISIRDNAGGIPPHFLGKIYNEPIPSSDKSRGERYGEGTVYVGYFVSLMQGIITVENSKYDDGNIGALTLISLPIISKELVPNGL